MGFLVSLVELVQNGIVVTIAGIKGMRFDVGLQPQGDVIYCRSTPPE